MQILGRPSAFGLESLGLTGQAREFWNLTRGELVEQAVKNGECILSNTGAIVVNTGKFTGRSAKDKYIVNYNQKSDHEIDWGALNQSLNPETAANLLSQIQGYIQNKNIYIQDLLVGADPSYSLSIRVITETAWHSLFSKNLLIEQPKESESTPPNYTVIQVPGYFASPELDGLNSGTFIILDFEKRLVLIGGTAYAGEIKKAVFSIMNRLLPEKAVLPMHCSANIGNQGDTALFFGLSGTGKTTLSSDIDRQLIGDDEHGWGFDGVFNFEGGCYAKTIGLKKEYEPLIWNASQNFGSVLENVAVDPITRKVNFDDCLVTENSRAAYPLKYIPNSVKSGLGGHPKNIFFLTADAFGVLPPISLLDPDQAMYYFLSGFTAKLAGTERGLGKEPEATFSTCFAAPFLPLPPKVYANLLGKKLKEHKTKVWLVNTGWSGGPYDIGERIKLPFTRAMIRAAINDQLGEQTLHKEDVFDLLIPEKCPGVPEEILDPAKTWKDRSAYLVQAKELLRLFEENYKKY
jgi:phosphoenolpyruvate carboxykinase (ATP)